MGGRDSGGLQEGTLDSHKMKVFPLLLAAIISVLALSGCAKSPLAGTWRLELSPLAQRMRNEGQTVEATIEFYNDGTWESNMVFGAKTSKTSGIFEYKDKLLKLTMTNKDGEVIAAKPEEIRLSNDETWFAFPVIKGLGRFVREK